MAKPRFTCTLKQGEPTNFEYTVLIHEGLVFQYVVTTYTDTNASAYICTLAT